MKLSAEEHPSYSPENITKIMSSLWEEQNTCEIHLNFRSTQKEKRFFDGPPFITGSPHYGHLLGSSLKDTFARFWTLKGFHVPRKVGWDCHGVPIELQAQKQLSDQENVSLATFNNYCRSLLKLNEKWFPYMEAIARWADFKNPYHTSDQSFMDSLWEVHYQLWQKKLIKSSLRVMPYSSALATSLSNFEASLDYRDIQDPAIYVTAKVKPPQGDSFHLLIWTTTPWTLPANTAIALHPRLIYVKVRQENQTYLIQKTFYESSKFFQDAECLSEHQGEEFKNLVYEPFFSTQPDHQPRTVMAEFVDSQTGTGLVHIAGAFGEDDFNLSKQEDLPIFDHLDQNGQISCPELNEWNGLFFKDINFKVIKFLKEKQKLFHQETYTHSYPHCWRSGKPLIYRAIKSWFIGVESLQQDLLAVNEKINWIPEHIKQGRFGNWLAQAKDWNYARSRFWGTPIPIWISEDGSVVKCIRNQKELESLTQKKLSDLHPEVVNDLIIRDPKTGLELKRIPEVFDCWFESGSMPFAQSPTNFDNLHDVSSLIPADFIVEGLDQTRGWFYTLTVLSTALFKKPPAHNIVVNGMVLAADGKKMSKSQKNFTDPLETLKKYGGDVVRLSLISSPASAGDYLRYNDTLLQEITKQITLPFWNSYLFLTTYGSLEGDNFANHLQTEQPYKKLDQWIVAKQKDLTKFIHDKLSAYRCDEVVPTIAFFLDDLNNWYIRRNRQRFWKSDPRSFQVLHDVLINLCHITSPFIPFLSDYIYQKLTKTKTSVHLTNYPNLIPLDEKEVDLIEGVKLTRMASKLIHSLRVQANLKVKFPLKEVFICTTSQEQKTLLEAHQQDLLEEINCETITWIEDPTQLAYLKVKPNFSRLGKKLGSSIKNLSQILTQLPSEKAFQILKGEEFLFEDKKLKAEDLEFRFEPLKNQQVAFDYEILCSVNPHLSEEQVFSGWLRETLSEIQKERKERQLQLSDRILLTLDLSSCQNQAWVDYLQKAKKFIEEEVLAKDILFQKAGQANRNVQLKNPQSIESEGLSFSFERL
jgi:isoleucyl-tRNA synthetase